MNKINKLMLLILMSSWCTPSTSMEVNTEKFNHNSGEKRKREREATSSTNEAKEEINLEPERKKIKWCISDEQADMPSFQFPSEDLIHKAESGDIDATFSVANTYHNILISKAPMDKETQSSIFEQYMQWTEKAAMLGHAEAQYQWAWIHDHGRGVKMEAEHYIREAHQGHAMAQHRMHEYGQSVEKDFNKAAEYYTKAADQGHAMAQYELGKMYHTGQGVEKNIEKAVKLYTIAAENGDITAQFQLGMMYKNGQDIENDFHKALELFTKAANQGDGYSLCALGIMYLSGTGVEKNGKSAVEFFTKAADNGLKAAQYFLGVLYRKGEGVEKNLKRAAQLYVQSAWSLPNQTSYLKRLFTFHQPIDQMSHPMDNQALTTQIEALRDILTPLHAKYIYKIGFTNGSGFDDSYGYNPIMQKIAERGAYLCESLQIILDNIKKPGFLITCLDFHQNVAGDTNLTELRYLIEGKTYISFYDEGLEFLESNELVKNLKKEQDEIAKVTKLLEKALSTASTKYDLDSILLGMVLSENSYQNEPSVLSAYLERYFTLNDLEGKKAYLERLNHFLERQQTKISNHMKKADDVYDQIRTFIKETTDYRNALFVDKVWSKV